MADSELSYLDDDAVMRLIALTEPPEEQEQAQTRESSASSSPTLAPHSAPLPPPSPLRPPASRLPPASLLPPPTASSRSYVEEFNVTTPQASYRSKRKRWQALAGAVCTALLLTCVLMALYSHGTADEDAADNVRDTERGENMLAQTETLTETETDSGAWGTPTKISRLILPPWRAASLAQNAAHESREQVASLQPPPYHAFGVGTTRSTHAQAQAAITRWGVTLPGHGDIVPGPSTLPQGPTQSEAEDGVQGATASRVVTQREIPTEVPPGMQIVSPLPPLPPTAHATYALSPTV